MKKKAISILLTAMLGLFGCGSPNTAEDMTRIAVVRNMPSDDHTKQYLEGCVSEGEAFGYRVDTFISDGDDAKFQELVAQVIQKKYDGLIISHGKADYSYDMLLTAVERGIPIVMFDTVAEKDGMPLAGVTSTSQDDEQLARLSLDTLVEQAKSEGRPARVIKVWYGPGMPPLDRRNTIYQQYEKDGLIETLETVGPSNLENVQGDVTAAVASVIPKYQVGEIDGVWGSWDELAKGALIALNDAGRTDIPLISIDISNQDINLMRAQPDVWTATAAVDPKLIGTVNMRLLAKKLKGEETPEAYSFAAMLIKTQQLPEGATMEGLKDLIPGWGVTQDFDESWMQELRAQNAGQ